MKDSREDIWRSERSFVYLRVNKVPKAQVLIKMKKVMSREEKIKIIEGYKNGQITDQECTQMLGLAGKEVSIINGMIYSHEIDKWVPAEEYLTCEIEQIPCSAELDYEWHYGSM